MLPDLKTFLKDLQLNEKEAEIYLTLLEIGSQAASVVAKRVNIPRSSVFFHLENLIKKGFVQKEIRSTVQYFSALPPEKIKQLLQRRKSKVDDQMEQLSGLIPSFKSITSPFLNESKVTYFEGVEGLCKMIDDVIQTKDELYFISAHIFHPEVRNYIRNTYVPARKKAKKKAEMIVTDSSDARNYVNLAHDIYKWVGFVEAKNIKFDATIAIYGNKIQFLSTKIEDLTGVLIENEFLANTMKSMFLLLKDSRKIKVA